MGLTRQPKPRKCPICQQDYTPIKMGQKCCFGCVGEYIKKNPAPEKARKMVARVDREQTKERKEKLKRLPDLLKDAQFWFNRYIRLRDAKQPCICCGMPLEADAIGGGFDAGHYRSVGAAQHLRFNEDNVHAQRKYCNHRLAGNVVQYRIGLIARIGIERVEAIENNNETHKWTREEVIGIAEKYKLKCKELERKHD